MILALVLWLLAAAVAALLWRRISSRGGRRLLVATSVVAVLTTLAIAAYTWIEADKAEAAAAQRVEAALSSSEIARTTDDLDRAFADADRAMGDLFGMGSSAPRYDGPSARSTVAEGELARARSEHASQVGGREAVVPVLTWSAAAYLLALTLSALGLWVFAGFAAAPVNEKESAATAVARVKRRSRFNATPYLLGSAAVAVFAAILLLWSNQSQQEEEGAASSIQTEVAQPQAELSAEATEPAADPGDEAPDAIAVTPTSIVSASWLVGSWDVNGECIGDSGQTFVADRTWGEWGVDGRWSLDANSLTVTRTTLTMDTASGGPEPITPPETLSGPISDATSDSFVWRGVRWGRCDY